MDKEKREEKKRNLIELSKKIFLNNLSIKLISIVGAVLIWLLIINIDDPYKTKTFLVRVEVVNEEALHSEHKVYEIVEGSTASVSVRGKRSIVDKLTTDDISATADLSELSSVNAVAIKARLKRGTSSDVVLECSQVMKVSVEDMDTIQRKLTVETEGTPAEGFYVGECTARPALIEVTGGSSVIDRINTVRVTVNVNGASQNITKSVEPVAYDKRGNRVMSSTLSFSDAAVRVRVKLMQRKTVPVRLKVSGTPAKGYEFVEAGCLPEEIEIAGSEKKLAPISQIVIPVDITGLTNAYKDVEKEVLVEDFLPDDITVLEDYQRITVNITIEKRIRKKIQIQTTKIMLSNVGEDYLAAIYGNMSILDLVVEGRESVLKELSEAGVSAYVDCSGLEEGIHTLPVNIELEDGCKQIKKPEIYVLISKKAVYDNETPVPSETPKPSEDAALPSEMPDSREE